MSPSFCLVISSLLGSSLFSRLWRLFNVILVGTIGLGATAVAEVAIRRENGHFQVGTAKYEATFNFKGCLVALKIGGEEFMASLPELPASYFYRSTVILPENVEESANALSARGNGVEWRWEFLDDGMTLHASNHRRQPVRLFVLFSGAVEEISVGDGADRFSVPHKAEIAGDVVLRRSNGALDVSGGTTLDVFRGQQVYTREINRGESVSFRLKVQ